MNIKNKEKERENNEKMRSEGMYDEDAFGGNMLFPEYFLANAASSTEATGLMQTIPEDAAQVAAYRAIYNFYQGDIDKDL